MANAVTALFFLPIATAVDWEACSQQIQSGIWGSVGGTDNHGNPVSNIQTATGITYDLCIRACGASSGSFSLTNFFGQFGSWLLPWLALVTQLHFDANGKLSNLVSMLLTVGSPTLAAYSLAITVLNGRWMARRLATYSHPINQYVVQVLGSLQQSPLMITTGGSLLASLVLLPENDRWWSELAVLLNYSHTWSVATIISIAWVVIAYVATLISAFTDHSIASITSNGQGVRYLWLWLLPIVIGWLQLSPSCDLIRLRQAIERANRGARVATPSGQPILASSASTQHAISLSFPANDTLRCDEHCSAPIYNYSRVLPWAQAVEDVCDILRRAHSHLSADLQVDGDPAGKSLGPDPRSRIHLRTRGQADTFCYREPTAARGNPWTDGILFRVLVASVLALSLQWGITWAAFIVVWFTPPIGLGCRSAAYLSYGLLSTFSWLFLVISSLLSHYSTIARPQSTSTRTAGQISIFLRRIGKITACINAVWIIVLCLLQFSNFFDQCYCNSSVLGLGAEAYVVLILSHDDITALSVAWVGGAVLGVGSIILCGVFVRILIRAYRSQSNATRDSEESNIYEMHRVLSHSGHRSNSRRDSKSPGRWRSTTI